MLLFREFLNSNLCLVSSSSAATGGVGSSGANNSPYQYCIKEGGSACCFNGNCCGGGSNNGTTEVIAEGVEEEDQSLLELFPRESSDFGLLEEIVQRFLPKSKIVPNKNCDSSLKLKPEAAAISFPHHQQQQQGYDDNSRMMRGFD
ncbi:uncharacterized protein LOC107647277 [Arachis ipaensis]|nr:uncharacterized protein LOC107647277 [Arachis ipaensis]